MPDRDMHASNFLDDGALLELVSYTQRKRRSNARIKSLMTRIGHTYCYLLTTIEMSDLICQFLLDNGNLPQHDKPDYMPVETSASRPTK